MQATEAVSSRSIETIGVVYDGGYMLLAESTSFQHTGDMIRYIGDRSTIRFFLYNNCAFCAHLLGCGRSPR